jgi:hypothetical protein
MAFPEELLVLDDEADVTVANVVVEAGVVLEVAPWVAVALTLDDPATPLVAALVLPPLPTGPEGVVPVVETALPPAPALAAGGFEPLLHASTSSITGRTDPTVPRCRALA